MSDFLKMKPLDFIHFLKKNGIRRFYFVYDANQGAVRASHPVLQPLADFLQNDHRDFAQHEGVFCHITADPETVQGAFIHSTHRGQAQGGTRFWLYDCMEDFFRDGLRLSKGMTRKNALAGLWWGGGKGVIAQNPAANNRDPQIRKHVFRGYGKLVTSLNGCYVTAEDVGTNTHDMDNIFSQTRFVTCIPTSVGGSGNPSIPTARGVVRGMQAAVKFLDGGRLDGRKVAVQGMGHVGLPLIDFLFKKGVAEIVASDINPENVKRGQEKFRDKKFQAILAERGDNSILTMSCDVIAPCATGAVLNPQSIPAIKAKIVCGAANNQLEDADRDDRLLFERGILYVPDFLVNRMGIVNCANEQYGYVSHDDFIERHLNIEWDHSIYQMTFKVLSLSHDKGEPPAQAAIRLADRLAQEPHPIFGHRGVQIIRSLIQERWHEQD